MKCGSPAKVTAVNKNGKIKMDVWYCMDHAKEGGLID